MLPRFSRFFLAASLAMLASSTWSMPPDDLFTQVSPSIWRVGAFDAKGNMFATGSAVVVGPQTLVTNCHVLKGAADVVVRQHNTAHRARLQYADTERDLCQLTAQGLQAPAVMIATQPAHIGQRIYTIGAPRGLELTLSDGLVSGLREEGVSGGLIQISAPISPGSSGGGLFDEDGRLLGITSSGVTGEAQNLNFARPASLIAAIPLRATAALQKWREQQSASSAPPAPPAPPAAPVAAPTPRPGVGSPVAVTDVAAVPFLNDKGREAYRKWLERPFPRAFALSRTGYHAGVHGTRPPYAAPSDPSARALQVCQERAGEPCMLYAVDDKVVYVPGGQAPSAAPPVAAAPPPAPITPGAPAPAGHIATGYAVLDDVDAVPYLSERGRKAYQEWLTWPLPRAFAIAPNGYFWQAAGTSPKDPELPVDPTERALLGCERAAKRPCKLYAVNKAVVWIKEPSPLGREMAPAASPPAAVPTAPR